MSARSFVLLMLAVMGVLFAYVFFTMLPALEVAR